MPGVRRPRRATAPTARHTMTNEVSPRRRRTGLSLSMPSASIDPIEQLDRIVEIFHHINRMLPTMVLGDYFQPSTDQSIDTELRRYVDAVLLMCYQVVRLCPARGLGPFSLQARFGPLHGRPRYWYGRLYRCRRAWSGRVRHPPTAADWVIAANRCLLHVRTCAPSGMPECLWQRIPASRTGFLQRLYGGVLLRALHLATQGVSEPVRKAGKGPHEITGG